MDPVNCALIVLSLLVIAIISLLLYKKRISQDDTQTASDVPAQAGPAPRRAQIQRGLRQRMRAQAAAQHDSDSENEAPDPVDNIELPDGKVGAKKLAKLQAKAERKSQREVEERDRIDRKKRQQLLDEERLKAAKQDAEEEKQREEEERKAREEKERKEHEEYLKMKAAFTVEEEGFEDKGDGESNLLKDFVNFIKDNKVVVLEDIAARFKLKTQNVIDRIQDLQNDGILSGVVDDRGKFIYISQDELQSVAKFIKQRGRVSIADLVESSNQLVNLSPSAIKVSS